MQLNDSLVKQVIIFLIFFITYPVLLYAQNKDKAKQKKNSLIHAQINPKPLQQDTSAAVLVNGNPLLNVKGTPVSQVVKYKIRQNKEVTFYLLSGLVLMMAFFRFFFAKYFTNLFKVFFNTSLRQNQLTDQLLQAKLPSLLFNLFFLTCGGVYIYSLLIYYHLITIHNRWILLGSCTGILSIIYFIKFCIIKFTGWLTGYKDTTNTYIFIIFLINKIIGIFLLPFIILITFSETYLVNIAVIVSLLIIGFMFLMRFLRSYFLLQNQLKFSRFHFFLFTCGIELLPLLLIYKGLMLLLSKNQ